MERELTPAERGVFIDKRIARRIPLRERADCIALMRTDIGEWYYEAKTGEYGFFDTLRELREKLIARTEARG